MALGSESRVLMAKVVCVGGEEGEGEGRRETRDPRSAMLATSAAEAFPA